MFDTTIYYNSVVGDIWNGLWDDICSLDWWAVLIWGLVALISLFVLISLRNRSNTGVRARVGRKGIDAGVNVSTRITWQVFAIWAVLAGLAYVLIAVCL